jgi:putative addiction module killer protein
VPRHPSERRHVALAGLYPFGYGVAAVIRLRAAPPFDDWLRDLRDPIGKGRVLARLRALSFGHRGDWVPVGAGLFELRIHTGPGYRIYVAPAAGDVLLLLVGGDKRTQAQDIERARWWRARMEESD